MCYLHSVCLSYLDVFPVSFNLPEINLPEIQRGKCVCMGLILGFYNRV